MLFILQQMMVCGLKAFILKNSPILGVVHQGKSLQYNQLKNIHVSSNMFSLEK